MKKTYVKPVAEKIEFDYRNQVVATFNLPCRTAYTDGGDNCTSTSFPYLNT